MGREFVDDFDLWADHYDNTVQGEDRQYQEVFKDYGIILDEVAGHTIGNVLEFGVGTGNLTEKLLRLGHKVYGVEPSKKMREKALEKLPDLPLHDGDFLEFPEPDRPIQSIVSSYAFHHLTDNEKNSAIEKYSRLLPVGGKIVFADTLYENEIEKRKIQLWAKDHHYNHLLKDLQTEYYPLKATLNDIFLRHHFVPSFRQLNRFVWLIIAERVEEF